MIFFADTVPATSNLLTMHCVLQFNGNVLSAIGDPSGLNGWTVTENPSAQSGTLDLTCVRSASDPILPNHGVASVNLQASVSDSISTPVYAYGYYIFAARSILRILHARLCDYFADADGAACSTLWR